MFALTDETALAGPKQTPGEHGILQTALLGFNTCVPEPNVTTRLLTFPMNQNLCKHMYFSAMTVVEHLADRILLFRVKPRIFPFCFAM